MSPFLFPPPDVKQPVVIYNDGGGLVNSYIAAAYKYRLEGRRVEIRGSCRSACLLALSVPNVCVGRNANVQTHEAYEKSTGFIRHDVTKIMLDELPSNIKRRLEGKIKVDYAPESTLDYGELRRLNIPDCDQTAVASDVTVKKPRATQAKPAAIRIMNPISGLVSGILSIPKAIVGR